MTTLLSRTGFLTRAAVLTGVTASGGALSAIANAAPPARAVYLLDPACGGCGSCVACRRHASNALFPTAVDADLHRAHPFCKCAVVRGAELPHDTWVALFGPPAAMVRRHVDRRTPWVIEALAEPLTQEALARPFDASPPEEEMPIPADELRASGPHAPTGEGLQIEALRIGTAKRAVAIGLTLSRKAIGHAKLLNGKGKVVASLRFAAPAGWSTTTLHVPNGVPPGRYRVVLDLRSGAGAHHTRRRPVVIS
jgi:hypothetical protein